MNGKEQRFLAPGFYRRDSRMVAKELLGKVLVRTVGGRQTRCRIVETEAYLGRGDPASHTSRGRTPRNAVMFGPPGRAYVYLNYGLHFLFNIVTEEEGEAGAVLIRALEPLYGIEAMMARRPVADIVALTNGPAKLTQALAINKRHNGRPIDSPELGVVDGELSRFTVVEAPRVGISAGQDLHYRYYIGSNRFVSKPHGSHGSHGDRLKSVPMRTVKGNKGAEGGGYEAKRYL
jgi:DNA-3-methyladenine glycosylase